MSLLELLTCLRWLVGDVSGELWDDSLLEGFITDALAQLNRVCPLTLQIAGLDGALETVLDGMADLLLRLARCLALRQRFYTRLDSFSPEQPDLEKLLLAEERQLSDLLTQRRLVYLQRSTAQPYAVWDEPETEV